MTGQSSCGAASRAFLKSSASWNWAKVSGIGLLTVLPVLAPMIASANPTGGTITLGSAAITKPATGQTSIRQSSEGVVIDWSSFNIGANQATTFVQPNAQAIAVNRIGDNSASRILGTLDANGRVVLINGNGLVFGKGAQVNVGSLIATSSDDSDSDILSGKANFSKPGSASASIINRGSIAAAPNGLVALVAPSVTNRGTINARLGTVALGAANKFSVDFTGDGLVSFATQGDVNGHARVSNIGNIQGANVSLTARAAEDVATGVVSVGGTIEARGAHGQGGSIVLDSGNGGDVVVKGTLEAKNRNGGGSIDIGFSGSSSAPDTLAGNVTIAKSARLIADASEQGSGGNIGVLSGTRTDFEGHVAARGGAQSGDGGLAEISSLGIDSFTGSVDTSAAHGATGNLLLDPENIMIESGTTSGGTLAGGTFTPSADNSILGVTDLQNALAHSNVTVATGGSGSTGGQTGDIVIASGFGWSTTDKLTLDAYHSIAFDAPVTVGGASKVFLITNDGGSGGALSFNGGDLAFTGLNGALSINGKNYTLAYNVSSLAAAIAAKPNGYFALGASYDATPDGTYANAPITTAFAGIFEGLGNSVSNLTINAPTLTNVGLFATVSATGVVRDIAMIGGAMTGGDNVGALVGDNNGLVANSSASSTVTAVDFNSDQTNGYAAGGLVGYNQGSIDHSSASGAVTGFSLVGGLAGGNISDAAHLASVTNSHASGLVTETGGTDAGGLIGQSATGDGVQFSTINNDYATGNVVGTGFDGGLVGDSNSGSLTNSYATGNVMIAGTSTSQGNGDFAGGLAGYIGNTGEISTLSNDYATGTVTGVDIVGGLVGRQKTGDTITNSYATGSVTGTGINIGGLIGENLGSITNSYALGTVSDPNGSDVGGLAGVNSGSIASSHAANNVTGGDDVGGLVGINASGTVTTSYATGSATGGVGSFVGGLVGYNGTTVSQSYAHETASGGANSDVGGLVGYNAGDIEQSYSLGSASGAAGAGTSVGGLVGNNAGTVNGAYAATAVNNSTMGFTGGVIGQGTGTVTSTYFDTQLDGTGVVGIGIGPGSAVGLTTSQLEKPSKMPGLTFGGLGSGANWVVIDADGTLNNAGGAAGATLPMLVSEYSTNVVSNHQLQLMELDPTATYTLQNFIEMNATASGTDVWSSKGFIPIGNLATQFTGTFNGNGLSIDGLNISQSTSNFMGLFGYVGSAGTIESVGLTNARVSGQTSVGALAGENDGLIEFSYAGGSVTGAASVTGGLVGEDKGTIYYSDAVDAVTGAGATGGLVGDATGAIQYSWAAGKVNGGMDSGGLVGLLQTVGMVGGSILNSWASGAVTGTNDVGGLVGDAENGTSVQGSYATGAVSGSQVVGGLAGSTESAISNSYATGTVTGVDYVGGLAGLDDDAGSIVNSHATGSVTGTGSGVAGSTPTYEYFGGLVGAVDPTSSVSGSNSSSVVKATGTQYDLVGGLVGGNAGQITQSYAALGSVTANGANDEVGGVVGGNGGSVSQSYSKLFVSVTGNNAEVGGVVGGNGGSISRSYALGSVFANGSGEQAGGVVGGNSGTVDQTYVLGAVVLNGSGQTGGIVGGNSGAITNSFFDTETGNQFQGDGSNPTDSGATGITTPSLQTSLASLNFDPTVWSMLPGQSFPYLSWQFTGTPQVVSGKIMASLGGSSVSGATVHLAVNGVEDDAIASYANGYFYFLEAPATIPSSNGQVLVGGGSGEGITLADNANGTTTNLSIFGGTLFESTSASNYSSVVTDLATAIGGNPDLQASVSVLTNLAVMSNASNLKIDQSISTGTLALATGGTITQTAPITATNLLLYGTTGNFSLTNTGNAIGTMAGVAASASLTDSTGLTIGTIDGNVGLVSSGNVSLITSSGNIAVDAALDTTGASSKVTLNSAGTIKQNGVGVITAATLTGSSVGGTALNDENMIGTLSTFTNTGGNVSLSDGEALHVGGAVSSGTGNLTLTTIGAGDGISITKAVTVGGTLALDSADTISQSAAGILTASTLTGTSSNGSVLGSANVIANLGAFTNANSGGFQLTDSQSLVIRGLVAANTGAASFTLATGDTLKETSTGAIDAMTLTGNAPGGATLAGGNQVFDLGPLTSGAGFTFDDSETFTVTGALSVTGTADLVSTGAIGETGAGAIKATTLTGSSVGGATLNGANAVVTLSTFSNSGGGGFALTAAGSLQIAGAVNSGTGSLSLDASGGSGNLSINSSLTAGATVTLDALGKISEATTASITAQALSADTGGAIVLGGPNMIGAISNLTSTDNGNITLLDGETLSIGAASDGTGKFTAETTAGDITIVGVVQTGTATLTSDAGQITESGAGAIDTTSLYVSANTGIDLNGPNDIVKVKANHTNSGPDVIDGVQ